MTKKICDRCGEEINPQNSTIYVCMSDKHIPTMIGSAMYFPNETELCASCADQLRQWLEGAEK